jgi:hypothetical protein
MRHPTLARIPSLIPLLFISIHIAAVTAPAQSPPAYSHLNTWNFNDTNWLTTYNQAPVSFQNLINTNRGNGRCLLLDASNPAWLRYNIFESNGSTNLRVDQGTVLFWFSPQWSGTNAGGTGPQTWARLIEVGQSTSGASHAWWSLYLNPEGTRLLFSAQTNNGPATTFLSAPVTWTNGQWHCIALTYSATNSTLYVDGTVAANGTPVVSWPGSDIQLGGFLIGSDSSGESQARGRIDDLSTYDRPLNAQSIASVVSLYSIAYEETPLLLGFSNAPASVPSVPGLNAIAGSGFLQSLGETIDCVSAASVWTTNVSGTITSNQLVTLTFAIQGGSGAEHYDVFANAILGPATSTNYHWSWIGQGLGCHMYQLQNLPLASGHLILGTPLDSDSDGLTDAYENLVSHTDSLNPDTDDDGISDAEELLTGSSPLTAEPPIAPSLTISRCPQ